MDAMAMRLGARFRQLREEQGISRAELARFAHCDRSSVHRIERGEMLPNVELLMRFAAVLCCDEIDFFAFRDENLRHALIEASRHATREAIADALRTLERAAEHGSVRKAHR